MCFITLDECLLQNKAVLQSDYAKLGTTEQSRWLNRKIFLSFDKEKGWSVVKLNWLQLMERKFLGLYQNTHFATIFTAFNQSCYRNPSLTQRLDALFFNPKKFFVSRGNTEIADAEVFVFPEHHKDRNYCKMVNRFINEHYREGDVVLAEGVPAGHSAVHESCLKPNIPVWGWEPENIKELTESPRFDKHHKMCFQMTMTWAKLKLLDPKKLDQKLGVIASWIQELFDYFAPQMPKAEILIKEYFDENALDPYLHFMGALEDLFANLRKIENDALYNHFTKDDLEIVEKANLARNLSLVSEIQKMLSQGKRVFVRAGWRHLFGYDGSKYFPEEVQSYLMQHKFVILGEKSVVTKPIMEFNKKLFSTKNKFFSYRGEDE